MPQQECTRAITGAIYPFKRHEFHRVAPMQPWRVLYSAKNVRGDLNNYVRQDYLTVWPL
jgi:hypothetical protein